MELFILILLMLNLIVIPILLYSIYNKIDEMHHFIKIMLEKNKEN